ncbi:MAG: hypothetical protein Q8K30_04615 [Candidatus Gracilibacteria bacterium]|nr:hypothetical protein [Candidatus Gracilibacteria bacterium]
MVAVLLKKTEVRNYFNYFLVTGLIFAEISNIFYWGIIPLPEFYDIFLLVTLILIIFEQLNFFKTNKYFAKLLYLGCFNNFLFTFFFFVWGYFEPEKDLNFLSLFGIPVEIQMILDALSLYSLAYVSKSYAKIIELRFIKPFYLKVILMETLLMIAVYILGKNLEVQEFSWTSILYIYYIGFC